MTKQEYLDLVQNSEIFKSFDAELQKTVLEATDEEMTKYAAIFVNAHSVLNKAKKEFIEENNKIIERFTLEVKNIKKAKFAADEKRSVREDQKAEENLLQEMNQL